MHRLFGFVFSALVAVALPNAPASAQSWPTRPLTLVVPFAAGGPSDVAGRIIAQRMSELLGQQVVVENPTGAGGTLGSNRVAKAAPDGYQFVIGNIGTHAWSSVALQETALRHCRGLSSVKPSRGIAARFDNGTKHFSEFAFRFHRLY